MTTARHLGPWRVVATAVVLALAAATLVAAVLVAAPRASATGLRTIWIDPVHGNDASSGATRRTAVRTLAEAWQRIPQGRELTTGIRLAILPGRLTAAMVPNYLESRYGTARAPILIEAAAGRGSVTMAPLNIFDTRHLTLRGVRIAAAAGDGFHCERCDYVTIEDAIIRGAPPSSGAIGDLLKVNQSQHIVIRRSDVSGASDNAIDFVAVQYGSIIGNRIHDAGDWCAYAKGGSRISTSSPMRSTTAPPADSPPVRAPAFSS